MSWVLWSEEERRTRGNLLVAVGKVPADDPAVLAAAHYASRVELEFEHPRRVALVVVVHVCVVVSVVVMVMMVVMRVRRVNAAARLGLSLSLSRRG